MRAKIIKESLEDFLVETKRESFIIKKTGEDEYEILDSEMTSIKKYTEKELISLLSESKLTYIKAKSIVDELKNGEAKIKLIIANKKIFE